MTWHDESAEDCVVVYDEEDPLGSAKHLIGYLEFAAGRARIETKEALDHLRHVARDNKEDKRMIRSVVRSRRRVHRARREAQRVLKSLRYVRDALAHGETSTMIRELRRILRLSVDKTSLVFRHMEQPACIEPTEVVELFQHLAKIDAGSTALH